MTIMKQLIEAMVDDYLNESYQDDLVESIFEEVSEETWEAIEEAILNELSPELLKRYKAKAEKDEVDATDKLYGDGKDDPNKLLNRIDKRSDGQNLSAKKIRKQSIEKQKKSFVRTAQSFAALNSAPKQSEPKSAIEVGKQDLNDLGAFNFIKKYRMTKSAWKRKNLK
jgi:hypothetical protein